ncbi:sigma-70 family RNA polymerase sigma factor [Actinoplanes awajinensis]|uniref:Alpha-L-arabinofuranosidase n=1 Tax=Actinoplanes awajinensis subsp. mycoplanecinus TaxID=135947 RepID=A0A0X3VDJ0_9ACTN|nr:sigma-70 family RNA polymerase sigma factor [Actinoplanes awajinensis]KUL41376.1 alpha-L-arabinofuranosidase [Actinoplanes awajinensis subsp. mycoplanecinus]
MAVTRIGGSGLVRAAQGGDRAALDALVAAHLPMVYTLVRQALDGHPDVDDVTQDIMLRALRQLPSLRSPHSFRPWLVAIALRQISTHQHRTTRDADRVVPLDEAGEVPDSGARFEGLADLHVELSAQRRQVRRAGRWLDPDDRILLALWWLEVAGRLTRAELAQALGITVVHAGVRVQRMRAQLELGRALVAALDARPGCPRLAQERAGWDGVPSPRWRKRLARHVRDCAWCTRAAGDAMPTDRLLPALVLLPVPVTLTAAALAKTAGVGGAGWTLSAGTAAAAGKAGVLGQLATLAAAHPVVAAVTAGTLIVGATAGAVAVTTPEAPRPSTIAQTPRPSTGAAPTPGAPSAAPSAAATSATASRAAPSASAGALRTGPASLEAANATGRYVTAADSFGILTAVSAGNTVSARRQSTVRVVTGLNDLDCFSFRTADGRYLRHLSWRLRVDGGDGSKLFRGDATFCPGPGTVAGSVTLESSNYPGWFLRHRGDELWVDQSDGTTAFRADGSFLVRPPLAG